MSVIAHTHTRITLVNWISVVHVVNHLEKREGKNVSDITFVNDERVTQIVSNFHIKVYGQQTMCKYGTDKVLRTIEHGNGKMIFNFENFDFFYCVQCKYM